MNEIIPEIYNKFFVVQNNNFGEYGGFNLSCGTKPFIYNNRIFNIFTCRYVVPHDINDKIIPGNVGCSDNIIPIKDKGEHFVWNNWDSSHSYNIVLNKIFIGEIINDKIQISQIIEDASEYIDGDMRFFYINSENNIHNYILTPRNYLPVYDSSKTDFTLYSINTNIFNIINNNYIFDIITFNIDITDNIKNCLSKKDNNLPIININSIAPIIHQDNEFIKLEILQFKWFQKKYSHLDILDFDDFFGDDDDDNDDNDDNDGTVNCITQFSFNLYIPTFDMINSCFENKDNIENIKRQLNTIDNEMCENKECKLIINNEFLIGKNNKDSNRDSHGFSFGTHFIDLGNNNFIGVGHIKLPARNSYTYAMNRESKGRKVQNKLYEFMNSLFGYNFKQNHSAIPGCINGYSYFSYFILYNKNINTFHISDFFLTADMNDKYHFSLLFTIGIMDFNEEYVYITSGEGDYYNSIMKFNKNDIVRWCKYNALERDFNINNINYSVIIKDINSQIHNIVINDELNIEETVKQFTGIYLIQTREPYQDLDDVSLRKKYLKYKNKYLKLKYKNKYLKI
jgi:hypothetical protein